MESPAISTSPGSTQSFSSKVAVKDVSLGNSRCVDGVQALSDGRGHAVVS